MQNSFDFLNTGQLPTHGLLYTWKEDSRPFFSKSEPAGILINDNNIICTSLKDEHFHFMLKGVVPKLSLPYCFEIQNLNYHKLVNLEGKDFSF